MLSNSSQRQLRLEFLETRVNPTRLWFAANALPIPIGTDTTTAITLQVPDALVVGDIDLWVNVTHERMDEISLRLRSPSGTIIQLATKQGGASKSYQNTIFDDQSANYIGLFIDQEGQRYQPEQSLGIFQQLSAQGEWQLLVDDANLQANVGRVNSFKLGFTTLPDDHGDSLSTATPLVSSNAFTWSESGSIENTGDRDWFVWTAPANNGSIQLSVNAANGSPIDTYLSLFDSQGVLIYDDDDSGHETNSALFTSVRGGVDYIIEVRDFSTSMGSYTVTLATIGDDHGSTLADDDHGSSPSTATPLTFSGSGTWSSAGSIQSSNDEDWFRWTAPPDATAIQVTMDAAGGVLRPSVTLRDSGGNRISDTFAYSDLRGGSAVFGVLIIPGTLYYIRAENHNISLGSYSVTLKTIEDDHGSTRLTATPLTFSGSGTWSSVGSIQYSIDKDWFRWRAPTDATLIQVTMDAAGGMLQPYVLLLDSGGNIISASFGYSFESMPGGSAVFTVLINPGTVYYISAAGFYDSLGSYTLTIVTSKNVKLTDLNNGIATTLIGPPEEIVAGDGLTTILMPAVGSAEGDVSNLVAIQVADEIIGGSGLVVNSDGNANVSIRDTIRIIKDAQEQLLIELRGFFAIIHTGALEILLFDADGKTSRLPRQWKLAMAPWVDGVMMELHAVDRQAAILFDLTSSGLKRVTAIVPPVWFDTVPSFTLEYATPDSDEPTSPWWASVVLMVGAKTWRMKKKSRLKV
jgi:subtilisin-like proprotein convertase family protein